MRNQASKIIVFLSTFGICLFFISSVWLASNNVSEAKPLDKDAKVEHEFYSDMGMLVNKESRNYHLELKHKRTVSFQVTGVGGNVDCVVFNEQQVVVQVDDSKKDGCDMMKQFVFLSNTASHFVVHNQKIIFRMV